MNAINKKNPFKGDLNHFHHIVNNYLKNRNLTVLLTIIMCILSSLLMVIKVKTYYIFIISVIVYTSLITSLKKKNIK